MNDTPLLLTTKSELMHQIVHRFDDNHDLHPCVYLIMNTLPIDVINQHIENNLPKPPFHHIINSSEQESITSDSIDIAPTISVFNLQSPVLVPPQFPTPVMVPQPPTEVTVPQPSPRVTVRGPPTPNMETRDHIRRRLDSSFSSQTSNLFDAEDDIETLAARARDLAYLQGLLSSCQSILRQRITTLVNYIDADIENDRDVGELNGMGDDSVRELLPEVERARQQKDDEYEKNNSVVDFSRLRTMTLNIEFIKKE